MSFEQILTSFRECGFMAVTGYLLWRYSQSLEKISITLAKLEEKIDGCSLANDKH